jgi:hypothetical protein
MPAIGYLARMAAGIYFSLQIHARKGAASRNVVWAAGRPDWFGAHYTRLAFSASEPSGPDLAAVRSLGRPGFARIPQVTDMAVAPKGGAGWLIPTGLAMAG